MTDDDVRDIDVTANSSTRCRRPRLPWSPEHAPLCEVCIYAPSRWRKCTRQQICDACRSSPEHKILTFAHARLETGLSDDDLLPLRQGFIPNPKNIKFSRVPVLFWRDLAELCMTRGLEIPD